jgi:hypothetical protein
MSFLTCRISAESAVFPGQHQTRTGMASRVTASLTMICGRSSRLSLDLPWARNPAVRTGSAFSPSPVISPRQSRSCSPSASSSTKYVEVVSPLTELLLTRAAFGSEKAAGAGVVAGRDGGDHRPVLRPSVAAAEDGYDKFLAAVRRELPRWGGKIVRHSVVRGLREALADTAGVAAQRPGALERLHLLAEDWELRLRLAATEKRMVTVLEGLGLAELAASIDGMSALSAGGNLGRDRRHGPVRLRPRAGQARRAEPLRAKYAHLTSRDANRLADGQARSACATALLRWLWAVITTGQAWDARIAAGQATARPVTAAAA